MGPPQNLSAFLETTLSSSGGLTTILTTFLEDTTKETLHRIPSRFAHLGLDMAVGGQRKGNRGVTKHLGHNERLHAFEEQKCRGGVPEIMRADIRQLCPFDKPLVLL